MRSMVQENTTRKIKKNSASIQVTTEKQNENQNFSGVENTKQPSPSQETEEY